MIMDSLIDEFDNLKISALSKSKLINKYVHDITIGPNSSVLNDSKLSPQVSKESNKKQKEKKFVKPVKSNNNKHTSVGKILTEIEANMKDEIASSIRSRLEKLQRASKELNERAKLNWVKHQESMINRAEQQEQWMIKVLDEHEKKASDHLQQLQLQQQKQAEERNKKNLEIQMKERSRRDVLSLIEAIHKQQINFRLLYQEIALILKECSSSTILNDSTKYSMLCKITTHLKSLAVNMEKTKENCKVQSNEIATKSFENSGQMLQIVAVTRKILENAGEIVKSAENLKSTLQKLWQNHQEQENLHRIKEQQEMEKKKIEEAQKATEPPTQPPPPPPPIKEKLEIAPAITVIESFTNKDALKEYSKLQQFLEEYKKSFAELVNDARMKQFRFHCQKAVNIPLNATSAVNSQHLLDKYNRLANLLRGISVEAGGTTVVSSQHPQGVAFCTDLLAQKFVLQGDLLISSNPDSAYCYAAVLLALWHDFPEFGKLVLAYFYQTVPYLIPFYPPKISGQSDQEYYVSLGYNYVNGVVEKQDKFLKRMSGITRLYSALLISRLKRGQHGPHPHGLAHGWTWIANVLNLEPRSDITASLLFEFLEVTGNSMQNAYGKQFQKILLYINNVYLEKMQKIDSGGPVTRLEVFLQKVKKYGQIEAPKGRLSEGFW